MSITSWSANRECAFVAVETDNVTCLGHAPEITNEVRQKDMQCLCDLKLVYRMSHLVANLGWVGLNLGSSLGWLAIQWVATAQARWWNIPNPCQQNPFRDQMGHPVC